MYAPFYLMCASSAPLSSENHLCGAHRNIHEKSLQKEGIPFIIRGLGNIFEEISGLRVTGL